MFPQIALSFVGISKGSTSKAAMMAHNNQSSALPTCSSMTQLFPQPRTCIFLTRKGTPMPHMCAKIRPLHCREIRTHTMTPLPRPSLGCYLQCLAVTGMLEPVSHSDYRQNASFEAAQFPAFMQLL